MIEANDLNDNFLDTEWWPTATIEDVKAELAKGADINAMDDNQITVLMYAASYSEDPKLIEALVELGADINYKGRGGTVIHTTAHRGKSPQIIKTLIKLGADINSKQCIQKHTPLHYAAFNSNPEILKTVLELGADPNVETICEIKPIQYAVSFNSNVEVIKMLLAKYQNLDENDLLTWAACNKNLEVIKMFLHPTIEKEQLNKMLMQAALFNENIEMLQLLIDLGAEISVESNKNILFEALENSNPNVIKFLVEHGADINAKDEYGKTALDYAEKQGRTEHINMLRIKP